MAEQKDHSHELRELARILSAMADGDSVDADIHGKSSISTEVRNLYHLVSRVSARVRELEGRALAGLETERKLREALREKDDALQEANRRLELDCEGVRLAELAVKETEQRYSAIAQISHEAIITTDEKGGIVFWNRGAEVMFGLNTTDMIGRSVEEILSQKDRAAFTRRLQRSLAIGRPLAPRGMVKASALRSNGEVFPVEMSVAGWESAGKNYFTAVVRDITYRIIARRELEKEKELLDVTLGSIQDGVISVDTRGNILLMNHVAEKLTGLDAVSAEGRPLKEVFSPIDMRTKRPLPAEIGSLESNVESLEFEEALLVSRSGESKDISCRVAPLRDNQKDLIGIVVVFRDVSERRQLQNELFRARKLESVGVLAGGIAHDFNNILTAIITNLFMAKTHFSPEDEAAKLLSEAESSAFRASNLTKQLLTFSKGGAPVRESSCIKEIIEDSVGFSLSGSNVHPNLDIPNDLHQVEIDRGQMDQVLNSLVLNAVEAMPDGGVVTVRARNIPVSDSIPESTESRLPLQPGEYVKVSITDQGVGIPAGVIDKVFDPYFTTKRDRSGLGLATVYSVIQNHGGHITVRSRPGEGSTFVFYLPVASQEEEKGSEVDDEITGGRVLVMDDEAVIRLVVEKLLRAVGFEVVSVSTGEEAIKVYAQEFDAGRRFDVVVMDLTIPGGMGGKQAVKHVLEVDPTARVVVASGYSSDPIMANYHEFGFCGVIAKPFSVDEFLGVIRKVVRSVD